VHLWHFWYHGFNTLSLRFPEDGSSNRVLRQNLKEEILRDKLMYSNHAITRMAQRCLSANEIEYVVRHGRRYYSAGVIHYFLGKKDIPEDDQKHDKYRKLEGATVLVDSKLGRAVITAYRNKSTKKIRRKAKFNLLANRYNNLRPSA
jgi:hypothetical protein